MEKILTLIQIAEIISLTRAQENMRTRVIAIDGCGGAGKSTLAANLSNVLKQCPVIHTDDFASWDHPLNWFPRMIEQVFTPLGMNKAAKFQRFDWLERKLSNWIQIDPQEFVIVEGVSSSRNEFRPYLSFSIYVQTSPGIRLQRGLARDGDEAKEEWLKWMAAENEYVERDEPQRFANMVVDGESGSGHSLAILR